MASIIPVPKALDICSDGRSSNWELFRQSWDNYELATSLIEKPEPQRVATLLSIIGYEALIVYNAFDWSHDEQKTVQNVLQRFENYCMPKKNVTYERFVFLSRKQKQNENINDYIVALRNLVRNCEYGNLTDSVVRDAIVMGTRNKKTQEILLRENNLTLDSCVNIVRAAERAKQHSNFITDDKEENQEMMEVDKITDGRGTTARRNNLSKCKYCGNNHVWGRKNCPANGKTCSKCGRNDHFAKVCRSSTFSQQNVNVLADITDEEFEIK